MDFQDIKKHISQVHDKLKSKCPLCEKDILIDGLKTHLETHNSNRKMFPCSICERIFTSKDHAKRHMLIHSNEHKTECPICKSMVADVKGHIRYVHDKIGKEECPKCGVKVKHLNKHMDSIHGEKSKHQKVSCPECKVLLLPESMKDHLLIHSGGQKSQCPICKDIFSNVRDHVHNVHEKKKKENCPACGAKVKHLELHMTKHHDNGVKETRAICKKEVFDVKKHMLIHGNRSKSISCAQCDKMFFYNKNLRRHIKLQHGSQKVLNPTAWKCAESAIVE